MFKYIKSLLGKPASTQSRGILLGLDNAGKTTLLYKLKRGEVTTTIPTIGLNIETVESPEWNISGWDVGGCDKIRPLWCHYFNGAQFLIFMVDCNDVDRVEEAAEELGRIVPEMVKRGGTHVFVMLNKQDLVPTDKKQARLNEMRERFAKCLRPFEDRLYVEIMDLPGLNVRTGVQLDEAMGRIKRVLLGEEENEKGKEGVGEKAPVFVDKEKVVEQPAPPTRGQLIEKIEKLSAAAEQDDDRFWNDFRTAQIPAWDHYTHLRAGYFVLLEQTPPGSNMFECADEFLKHLERLRTLRPEKFRNTSHRTMTIFWLSRIQIAARRFAAEYGNGEAWPARSQFRGVMLHSPQLMDGGVWKEYYSKEVMFGKEAREGWTEPDLRPLAVEVGGGEDLPAYVS